MTSSIAAATVQSNGRAGNALRHGLTAQKALTPDLAQTVAEFRAALRAELSPRSTLDQIFVDELARHAAAMQHAAEHEAAALRSAQKQAQSLDVLMGGASDSDEQIAAMMSSDSVDRTTRYRRHHERAFYTSLAHLRNQAETPDLEIAGFENEDACRTWLWDWQHEQPWHCPQCGSCRRNWLRARWRWECACGRQFSVRHQTIYSSSRIPLERWFACVIAIVVDPCLSTSALAGKIGLPRRATVAVMSARVRQALDSASPSVALAGLNEYALAHLRQVAVKTNPKQNKSQPERRAAGASPCQIAR